MINFVPGELPVDSSTTLLKLKPAGCNQGHSDPLHRLQAAASNISQLGQRSSGHRLWCCDSLRAKAALFDPRVWL